MVKQQNNPQLTENKGKFDLENMEQTPEKNFRPIVAISFGILLFGVITVFVYLPSWLPEPELPDSIDIEVSQPKPEESPFIDAQLAKARRDAQEVLSKLVSLQQELETKAVNQWANQEFNRALENAEQGDQFYKERDFTQAQTHYEAGLELLQQLDKQAETELHQALQTGNAALIAGAPPTALSAFTLATAIDSENQAAIEGLNRAQKLPQVLDFIDVSQKANEDGDLDKSLDLAKQAVNLDPKYQPAQQQVQLMTAAVLNRDHNQVMAKGFALLANKDASEAISTFKQALALKPQDANSKDALRQANELKKMQTIEQWLNKGVQQEQAEDWQQALAHFQQAQRIDGKLVESRIAQLRAKARLDLDQALVKQIENPLTLKDPKAFANANQLLAQAQKIQHKGPRINQQIQQLTQQLSQSRKPVTVVLQSDNRTQIQIFKIGELGSFQQKEINLIPGRYVVLGQRQGYRDIRHELTVEPGVTPPALSIRCEEKVNG